MEASGPEPWVVLRAQSRDTSSSLKGNDRWAGGEGSTYSQQVPEIPRGVPGGPWSQICFPDPSIGWLNFCPWVGPGGFFMNKGDSNEVVAGVGTGVLFEIIKKKFTAVFVGSNGPEAGRHRGTEMKVAAA